MMMCSYNQQSQKSSEEENREKWKETFLKEYLFFRVSFAKSSKRRKIFEFLFPQKRKKKDDARGDDDDDDADDDDIEKRFGRW